MIPLGWIVPLLALWLTVGVGKKPTGQVTERVFAEVVPEGWEADQAEGPGWRLVVAVAPEAPMVEDGEVAKQVPGWLTLERGGRIVAQHALAGLVLFDMEAETWSVSLTKVETGGRTLWLLEAVSLSGEDYRSWTSSAAVFAEVPSRLRPVWHGTGADGASGMGICVTGNGLKLSIEGGVLVIKRPAFREVELDHGLDETGDELVKDCVKPPDGATIRAPLP